MSHSKIHPQTDSMELSDHERGTMTKNSSEIELSHLGRKSVLRRDFGFVSMLGLSCTSMVTWEGVVILFVIGFSNGGYAGAFWGYILVWLGMLASITTMAELSSMAPTAGGQYHWVAMLSPRSFNKFLSYLVGWSICLSWLAVLASGCFIGAQLLQGLITMANNSFTSPQWQVPLLYWAYLLLAILFNTVVRKLLPSIESIALILHIVGFIVILIPLVVYAPSVGANTVFNVWLNEGMWPTQGLSFMVGLVGPAFSLQGADSAVHMAEEIKNPAITVPRAMLFSVFINGLLGVAILLALLFALEDPTAVLEGPTAYPFMNIFLSVIPNTAGAITMASIVFILSVIALISFVAATSRLVWAFARDRAIPGWATVAKIHPKTNLPLAAIAVCVVSSIILSFIGFGSALAFNDVVSLAVAGLYTSYLIGNSLLLWRRIRGDIKPYNTFDEIVNVGPERLAWGPWKIPEPFGTIINAVSCLFLATLLIFIYFPVGIDPTPAEMNWAIFMAGVVGIFSVVYYLVIGRKSYSGPVIDLSE